MRTRAPVCLRATMMLATYALTACREPTPPPPPSTPAFITIVGGDRQAGRASQVLPLPLVVLVNDQDQKPLGGITVHFAALSGGGSMRPDSAITAADGQAETRWTLGPRGGAQAASASIPSVGSVTFTASAPIPVSLPPGAKLAFTVQPRNATAGVVITPAVVVTIEDSLGRPVAEATDTVKIMVDDVLNAVGNAWVSAVKGVATFANLSLQGAGRFYLTAVCDSLAPVKSDWFAITPAAAAQLGFSVQPNSTWPGQSITPAVAVRVEDAFHNLVPQATNVVTLALGTNANAGTLSGATSASAVNGVATFSNLAIDRSGIGYTLAASAAGLTGIMSGRFDVHLLWASVSAGAWHSCGISVAGGAYCWGWNHYGQLGNGTLSDDSVPVPIAGGLRFATLSGGGQHTCGITSTGGTYCWGDDEFGELGNGDTTHSSLPVAVTGGLFFATVSAGDEYHTCALTSRGAAYCWGRNSNGQLGTGDTVRSATPVGVSGGYIFVAVSAGSRHTCGLTTAGAAYCWGDNTYGQLGVADTISRATPVAVSGGLTFAALHSGYFHTCGLTSAGVAYCWGQNGGGLGNGATANSAVPVQVSGSLSFTALNAGSGFTCGIAADGAAYCWGSNVDGQLGTGSVVGSVTPAAVAGGGLSFSSVNPGAFHTCGVTTIGAAYCWGFDNYGQLGSPPNRRRICANPFARPRCTIWIWVGGARSVPIPVSDPRSMSAATMRAKFESRV